MIIVSRDVQIGTFTVDATLSESHRIAVEVTDLPTEDGRISGGVKRTLPRTCTIAAVITNRDMRLFRAAPFVDGSRHVDGWERLKELVTSIETFDVVTEVDTYRNCTVVDDVTWDRDPSNDGALVFSITIREVQAGSVLTQVAEEAKLSVQSGTDLGRQGTEVVE